MPRKQKQYHYLYKTTNLINNKFYVGMHSTDNLEDGYLGSGKRLKYSISKYGIENFKIEHLEFFDDRKILAEREKNLVNEDLLNDPMCMNLAIGGEGGFINEASQFKRSQAGGIAMNKIISPEKKRQIGVLVGLRSYKLKKGIHDGVSKFDWNNKKHKESTKNKMREKAKLRIGEKNSQFGTCWITNNLENKKIKKEELNHWLNNGWIKGRRIVTQTVKRNVC